MRLLLKKLLSYYPTKLPVGMTEHKAWVDSIIELAGPIANRDSMEFVISAAILNMSDYKNPKTGVTIRRGYIAKNEFVQLLIRSAASQVASQVIQDIKAKQAEEQQKAAQQQAELAVLEKQKNILEAVQVKVVSEETNVKAQEIVDRVFEEVIPKTIKLDQKKRRKIKNKPKKAKRLPKKKRQIRNGKKKAA